jgi:cell division protein FtsL
MTRRIALVGLFFGVVMSAMLIVVQRHEARKVFNTVQELEAEQNELDQEWGQLLLEQGTWGTHGRIEDIAREKLNMTLPVAKEIFRVRS